MKRAGVLRTMGFLTGAFALAYPAQAQEAPQAPAKVSDFVSMREAQPDDIVVTARPEPTPQQVDKQAREITRVDGSVLREPIGQFRSRLCPGVIGMPKEMAELIVGRIRYNGERIGLPAADETVCRPNIILIFVRDGKAELQGLAKTQSHIFAQISMEEYKELLAEPGPVYAWSNTAVRSRFGDQIQGQASPGYRNLANPPVLNVSNSHSHIFSAHRVDIEAAVIMIDVAAVDGMSINQIADYATMRSFARTRPVDGDAAASTILSLFDPDSAAPQGLTMFDLAYLKSLYASYDSARAVSTIAATSREVKKAAAKEASSAAD